MTRKTALAFGIGASLILAAGTASADCATEVQALQQQLGMTDTTNATIGASDPGVQQPDPGASTDMSATDSTTTDTTTGGSSVTAAGDNDANATIGATDLSQYDWVVFTSAAGVSAFLDHQPILTAENAENAEAA